MKTIRQSLATIILLAGINGNAQNNLVKNGGFETADENGRPLGWHYNQWDWEEPFEGSGITEFSTREYGTEDPKEGVKYGYQLIEFGSRIPEFSQMFLAAQPGETYKLSFWYKPGIKKANAGPSDQERVAFQLNDSNYAQIMPDWETDLTYFAETWLFYESDEIIMPQTLAEYITFSLMGYYCQDLAIDDVKLIKVGDEGSASCDVSNGNLLVNGCFETLNTDGKPQDWGTEEIWNNDYTEVTIGEGEQPYTSSNDVPSGNTTGSTKSGSFYPNPAWNPSILYPVFKAYTLSQKVPQNGTLKLEFWSKIVGKFNTTDSTNEPKLTIGSSSFFNDYNNPSTGVKNEAFDIFEGEWVYNSREFASSTEANDFLILGFNCDNCSFLLDDVSLLDATNMSVSDVKANGKLNIYRDNGVLYVAQKEKENIEVYNAAGQLLKKVPANTAVGTTKIEGLPRNQMLIIRSGAKTAKAIL